MRFAESDQPDAIEKLIDDKTSAVFCESVGNPAGNICDIEALADGRRTGTACRSIVDNTVATPILLRPIDYGADIVVHSLTKFMGGHGTTLGGAIVDSGSFPWKEHARRFPMFNEPDASYHGLVYTEHFGDAAYIARCRSVYQRTTGAVLSPLSAFLLLQGIETVALRVERHVENARRVAEFLRGDPRVDWVNYAGFADSPYHALAQKYLGGRACSLMTFGVAAASKPASGSTMRSSCSSGWSIWATPSRSPAIRPRPRTGRCRREEQSKAGVSPEMIRLSIGIEHIDDIIADLDQALAAAQTRRSGAAAWPPNSAERKGRCRFSSTDSGRHIRSRTAAHARQLHRDRPRQQHARCRTRGDRAAIRRAASARRAGRIPSSGCGSSRCRTFRAPIAAAASSRQRYRDVAELWDSRLDGLIVTGTEPRAADLRDEPYWTTLGEARRLGATTTPRRPSGRASPPTRPCSTPTASSAVRWRRSSSACSIAAWCRRIR